MKISQKKAGAILSYASEAVKILTTLLYTPVMLRLLGQSEYGLYQLVFSVVSYLSLLSLGFGSSYVRYFSKFKTQNDKQGEARLNGIFMIVFLCMTIVCVLCGGILIRNITLVFGRGLNESEYETAKTLMFIMVISIALTFPSSVFNCIITANEKFIFQKCLILIQNLMSPLLSLPLLILGYGSVGMVGVSGVLTLVVLIVNGYYVINVIEAKFEFKHLDFHLLKEMGIFTFFIFLNQIIDQINWSVDKYLLGRISGTLAVAVYGVGGQINSLYVQFSSSISSVFAPQVNKLVAEGNHDQEINNLFIKVGRIQFYIMFLIFSGFVFVGKPFIRMWAGEEYFEAYYIGILLLGPVTIPLIQNLGIEIQRAKNKHQARSIVYFFIAVLNLVISIPLIHAMGPTGAALGTAITMILGNGIFMNIYYKRAIMLNIKQFWKNIFQILKGMIIPIIVGILIYKYINITNWPMLFIVSLVYSIIYAISVWLLSFNEYERRLLLGRIISRK